MDVRQQLVEEWKGKLAASSQTPGESAERFTWARQIYTRIYRFLVSCYGQGEWRGAGDDSRPRDGLSSDPSQMPFVDFCPTTDGLAPKSPERIRAALDSIHSSNPGIATAGTMSGAEDVTWVVVAASRQAQYARAVHRRLVAFGINACLQDRTTDTAVIVRHEDFSNALAVVKQIGRAKQVQVKMRGAFDVNTRIEQQSRISARVTVDTIKAAGAFLFIACLLTLFAFMLLRDAMQRPLGLAICTLSIAGLASAWLYARGRRTL